MNWTQFLEIEAKDAFQAALGLVRRVEDDKLDWRPPSGDNWMTTGQLIQHMGSACGFCCAGFVNDNWDELMAGMSGDDMLPSAKEMPSASSVADAIKQLEADRDVALQMIAKAGEDRLANDKLSAPWNPSPRTLGLHCKHMIDHLNMHRAQLFYYLKLQGQPVNTNHLYGGEDA